MSDSAVRGDTLDADLLELIADSRPVAAPTDVVLLRARQSLAGHTGSPASDPSRRTVITAAALAAAATVTGVSIGPKLFSSNASGNSPDLLARPADPPARGKYIPGGEYAAMAGQVLTLGLPDWRPAGFWYLEYLEKGEKAWVSEWIGHRSPGRVEQYGHPTSTRPPATYAVAGESLAWDALWLLPTDPLQLLRQLRRGYPVSGGYADNDSEVWITANELVGLSPAPPRLRSALFHVLSTLPGLIVHETRDQVGRFGQSFERQVHGLRASYVYDLESGTLLEKRVGPAVTTFLEIGWVDSTTSPPGPAGRLPRPPTTDETQSLGGPFGPYSIYSPAPATSQP